MNSLQLDVVDVVLDDDLVEELHLVDVGPGLEPVAEQADLALEHARAVTALEIMKYLIIDEPNQQNKKRVIIFY